MRIAGLVALFLPLAALASIPSLQDEEDKCATPLEVVGGSCVPYPADGICSAMFPAGTPIYLPANMSFALFESTLAGVIGTALNNRRAINSDSCLQHSLTFTCASRVYPCVNSSTPAEPLPILPCASYCADYWTSCNVTLELYYQQVLNNDYNHSQLINCALGGTFSTTWGATPQPPDVWGGRPIPDWMNTVDGLKGQEIFPNGEYNYSFANGTVQSLMCGSPNTSVTVNDFVLPPPKCPSPLQLADNGVDCIIACPLPIFDDATQLSIQWAFIAPALIGVVLCIFTMVDSIYVIATSSSVRWRAFMPHVGKWSSAGPTDSSDERHASPSHDQGRGPSRRQGVRSSTVLCLLGSVLGILYFVIGPLQSLIHGSQLSCTNANFDLHDLTDGGLPAEPPACAAQRASPFVLQAIFNLILYSMFRVYLTVNNGFKSMPENQRALRVAHGVLAAYCFFIPLLTLIIGFSIDKLSDEALPASLQLARQSTNCQLRVSIAAEWLLVFVPFMCTGLAVVGLSISILLTLRDVQKKLNDTVVKTKTASDLALQLFMQRLMGLGLATFVVLLIVIASTSAYTAQVEKFAPAFITTFLCTTNNIACVDCSIWANIADARKPDPGVVALQLAAMSTIVVLFGTFFFAQTVSRILKDRRMASATQTSSKDGYGARVAAAYMTNRVDDSRAETNVVTTVGDSDAT